MTSPRERDFTAFEFEVFRTSDLPAEARAHAFALFDATYRQANHAYLAKSLGRLRYLSLATRDGVAAGFAVGETRVLDLPRLPRQTVALAGICCVHPNFRRRGLFGKLESLVLSADRPPRTGRTLSCGRMAHPASMRGMARNPTVVPKPGVRPTAWQREVGQAIAGAYGVHAFDPETFVCVGAGEPIGYPILDIESEPEEWEVFRAVNRDRGDALLAIAWNPDAPPGW